MAHQLDSANGDHAGPTIAEIQSQLPLENAQTGNRITTLRQYGDSTIEFEAEIAPSDAETPQVEFAHIHPTQQQRVTVLAGLLQATVGSSDNPTNRHTLQAGQEVDVPPKTPHRFWNDSDQPTQVRVALRPGHGFEQFLFEQYTTGQRQTETPPEWHGDVIENTMTGELIRFCKRAIDTEGRLLQYDLMIPPGIRTLDYHSGGIVHPNQTKYVRVTAGLLLARNYDDGLLQQVAVNDSVLYVPYLFGAGGSLKLAVKGARFAIDQRRRMTVPALAVLPGDEIVVQPGVPHQLWNPGPEPTRLRIELQPALQFEQFLEMMFGLARDGLVFDNGVPMSYRQWHVITETYNRELQLPKSKTLRAVVANVNKYLGESQGFTAWDRAYSPAPDRSAAAGSVRQS